MKHWREQQRRRLEWEMEDLRMKRLRLEQRLIREVLSPGKRREIRGEIRTCTESICFVGSLIEELS